MFARNCFEDMRWLESFLYFSRDDDIFSDSPEPETNSQEPRLYYKLCYDLKRKKVFRDFYQHNSDGEMICDSDGNPKFDTFPKV